MPNNNDQVLEINGRLILDSNSADTQIAKLISSMKKLETTSLQKLTKDFQMVAPVIKGIDSQLYKFLDSLNKVQSKSRIGDLNKVLREQANLLNTSAKEAKRLGDELAKAAPGTKNFENLSKAIQVAQQKSSSLMAGIQQGSNERSSLQQSMNARLANGMSGAGRALEMGGQAGEFWLNHFGGAEMRRQGYQTQYNAPGQNFMSMAAFDPIAAGFAVTKGKLGSNFIAGENEVTNRLKGSLLGSAENVLGAALSGGGTNYGAPGGNAGTAGLSMLQSGGAQLMKEIAAKQDLADQSMRGDTIKGMRGANLQTGISNALGNTQFLTDLTHELLSAAPGRMAAGESLAGAGGMSSQARARQQAVKYGIGEGEALSGASALGMTGITAGQRSDSDFFFNAQRKGLGNVQQNIQGGGNLLNMLSNTQDDTAMRKFTDAVEDGIIAGFKNPQISQAFVGAATEIAGQGSGKIGTLDSFTKELRGVLAGVSGRDLGGVSRSDIGSAKSATEWVDQFRGGKSTLPLAQNIYSTKAYLEKQGFKNFTRGSIQLMAQTSHIENLIGNHSDPSYQGLLEEFAPAGIDRKTRQNYAGALDQLLTRTHEEANDQTAFTELYPVLGQNFKGILSGKGKKEFRSRLMKGDEGALDQYDQMVKQMRARTGPGGKPNEAEFRINSMLNLSGGDLKKIGLPDISAGSQERAVAGVQAGAATTNDAIRGSKEVNSAITDALTAATTMQGMMMDPDKGLPKNLDDLTQALKDLTATISAQMGLSYEDSTVGLTPLRKSQNWHGGVVTSNKKR